MLCRPSQSYCEAVIYESIFSALEITKARGPRTKVAQILACEPIIFSSDASQLLLNHNLKPQRSSDLYKLNKMMTCFQLTSIAGGSEGIGPEKNGRRRCSFGSGNSCFRILGSLLLIGGTGYE